MGNRVRLASAAAQTHRCLFQNSEIPAQARRSRRRGDLDKPNAPCSCWARRCAPVRQGTAGPPPQHENAARPAGPCPRASRCGPHHPLVRLIFPLRRFPPCPRREARVQERGALRASSPDPRPFWAPDHGAKTGRDRRKKGKPNGTSKSNQ